MGLRVYEGSTASLHSAYAMRTHVSYAGTDGHGRKKNVFGVCEKQRRKPACASAQSGQRLYYSLFAKYFI